MQSTQQAADLTPVNAVRHAGLRLLDAGADHHFARRSQVLPLALAELPQACLDYPCLFRPVSVGAGGASGFEPVALLGLRDDENLFVDAQGRWEAERWIPAQACGHPFALIEGAADDRLALGMHTSCPGLQTTRGERLFTDDGAAAPWLQQRLALLVECRNELQRGRRFAARLAALDLLVPHTLYYASERRQGRLDGSLDGLYSVDAARLATLGPAPLRLLHASGDLALVHAQLLSLQHLPRLAHRLAQRLDQAAKPQADRQPSQPVAPAGGWLVQAAQHLLARPLPRQGAALAG